MVSNQIPSVHGRRLLKLARETIAQRLGLIEAVDQAGLEDEGLSQDLATFITLKKDGQLRGCIGNLEATGPLLESLSQNARHAAFNDHRFSPLSAEEFDQVLIDISILGRPEQLNYEDGNDLLIGGDGDDNQM